MATGTKPEEQELTEPAPATVTPPKPGYDHNTGIFTT